MNEECGKNQRNGDVVDEEMSTSVQDAGYDTDEEGGLRIDEDIYIPPPPRGIAEIDANGPRLMITKIVNENFKSYAGKQVVGPFHKCFSAIIGPNGSGKSNVIDSMLFVFGYRASKIRSKKISVLIHNSSEHPNVTSCTVSVHFQCIIDKPGSEYDVVSNSEFVISRKAFKDNSSYYELSGKKVQFKEIAKLLRSHGVDLDHNRFLILQGEVEQIAMMKPKGQTEHDIGMLEFLEDIIGTVRYKEPLEKLSEKVEMLTELRTEKLNRVHVVQNEKAALEEPMQDVLQYLRIENEVITLQHRLYHCKKSAKAKELALEEQKTEEIEKDVSDLKDEMKAVHEEKEEKSKTMKEKSKKWEKLQLQKNETTAKFDKIRKQDESLHAELVETNKRRKANNALVKTEQTKLEELHKQPEKNASAIKECEELIERESALKKKEEAALEDLMSGMKKKTKPLLDERSKLEVELISLRKNVNEAKAAYDIANSELELYTSVENTEKEKLERLKNTVETTTKTLAERKQQLASLAAKIPATEESLTNAQKELNDAKGRETELTARLKKLRISYEEQRSAMQANRSRNRVLDALMREKREGRLPGIFGRLGDLGAIDAKYDVAISTACGPLDNIVVDTVSTAQACITFLRNNDLGRTTFIALEKQQHFLARCEQRIDTPERVPRLFDLIKVEDERVLPAFYYGLQDTLAAQDLDQATRIAYGKRRYRVVTLKGELIEMSGTMSGGGRTAFRGRMGQKVVSNDATGVEIEKLQSELDGVYEECNRLRSKQPPLEGQIHTLATALRDMKLDKDKFAVEVRTLKEQEPLLKAQLKAQERKAKEAVANPEEVASRQKAVEKAKQRLDVAQEESDAVESEVNRINRQIDDISGNCVKEQQKKIANLAKAIDKARSEICRLQVAMKTAERNVKKTEQRIESLENDVHECEQRLRDIQQEKAQLEEEAKVLLEEQNALVEALAERDELLASFKEELNALQTRENKMKALKIDLDQKLSEKRKAVAELRQKIPEYGKRIEDLKLHAIPGEAAGELHDLPEEEVELLDERSLAGELQKAKERLPAEVPNMQLIADYREKDALYMKRVSELDKITAERNGLRDVYEGARRRRVQEFLNGFSVITDKLKEMYQMITLGGDAELELVDSLDPFSEGIVFSVRPPRKSWKNISNLSGGEKTLSSLALVFALHHYKPTPIYFMDEIDAALDFKNVSIVGNYIKERTKNAQFIVISLRTNMFELADYLVGIFKTHNCTQSVTIDPAKFYGDNAIKPPSQPTCLTQASQPARSLTQVAPVQRKESDAAPKGTCPARIEQTTEGSDEQSCFKLPELGLCPTPQKARPKSRASSTDGEVANSEGEDAARKAPVKKKRKLQ